jgi:hypothetical protein
MKQFAPKPVRVASGFGTPGGVGLGSHGLIIETGPVWQVLVAVAEIEDLECRIRERFATGAPYSSDERAIG